MGVIRGSYFSATLISSPSKEEHVATEWPDCQAGMHWKGGDPPTFPARAPSLCPAAVCLTATASFNGICNRQ